MSTKQVKKEKKTEEEQREEDKKHTDLIEAVRGEKCLYDLSHAKYKDNILKRGIWSAIANRVGFEGQSIFLRPLIYIHSLLGFRRQRGTTQVAGSKEHLQSPQEEATEW